LASLNVFLKIAPTRYSVSLFKISVIILETFFNVSFPTAFAPQYKRVLTKRMSPLKKDPILLPLCTLKTVNRTNLTTTTMIYVVPCISIHCNYHTETNYTEVFFLKCNITRHGISLFSNNTFSPVFINRQIEIDSKKDCSTVFYNG
jgi:hypothetical protein